MSPLCPTKPLIAGSWRRLLSTGGICGHYKVTLRFGRQTERSGNKISMFFSVFCKENVFLDKRLDIGVCEAFVSACITECVEKAFTSGRLAARPPWWWAPVVALGNRCQEEGPSGAGPAGNASSVPPPKRKRNQVSMCRSWRKEITHWSRNPPKILLFFPEYWRLKQFFKIGIQCKKSTRKSLYCPMSRGIRYYFPLWGLHIIPMMWM